jgi:hypothetical protein
MEPHSIQGRLKTHVKPGKGRDAAYATMRLEINLVDFLAIGAGDLDRRHGAIARQSFSLALQSDVQGLPALATDEVHDDL